MDKMKVISSEPDYRAALEEIEKLMDLNPEVNSSEGDYLDILTLLVADYESKSYSLAPPDPINAIKFRMEQIGLSQRDLVPYIGSRSKVSEILSRKRPLTLTMIKALHSGLGIPAKVFLEADDSNGGEQIEWDRFPIKEMLNRGWIAGNIEDIRHQIGKVLRPFFVNLGLSERSIHYRKTDHIRSARAMDIYALLAWTAYVVNKAADNPPVCKYSVGTVDLQFMQQVARLSWSETGPLIAREFLNNHGISLIVEPQLPSTHLDGSAIMIDRDRPVIGLTLRYDRIDNFWFSLMHELAHISLHIGKTVNRFYDDLDVESKNDQIEREADEMASEALIPKEAWIKSAASRLRSPEAAESLAKKLEIHPAIVAGRMRHEFKAYRLLNSLVGHKQVRKLFHEVHSER